MRPIRETFQVIHFAMDAVFQVALGMMLAVQVVILATTMDRLQVTERTWKVCSQSETTWDSRPSHHRCATRPRIINGGLGLWLERRIQ